MTVTSKVLVQGKRVEAAPTIQYTSTNCKTLVDNASVLNTTGTPATLTAHLVPNGGAASDLNMIADAISIAGHDTYLFPELVGRRLDSGDTVVMFASGADTLSLRMDGRQVTA